MAAFGATATFPGRLFEPVDADPALRWKGSALKEKRPRPLFRAAVWGHVRYTIERDGRVVDAVRYPHYSGALLVG